MSTKASIRSLAKPLPLLLLCGLLCFPGLLSAAPMPLKEVLFLLRQRTPEPEILEEISRRKLAEKPTQATLDKLLVAGASDRFVTRIQAPELVAPPPRVPVTPADPSIPAAPPESAAPVQSPRYPMPAPLADPPPRPGTVAAALQHHVFLESQNELSEYSMSVGGEPKTYLLFFTRADDKPSRKFIGVVRDRLNEWMRFAEPRPLEICRARDKTTLVRHAIGRKALWPLARYEELDPKLQALCPKAETRIALITQDWEVLVNEVAPPADLAMSKVRAVLNDRFKVQMR